MERDDDDFEFQCSVYDLYNPRGHDIDDRAFLNHLRDRIDNDPDDDDLAAFINDINIILDRYYDNNAAFYNDRADDVSG